MALVYLFQGTRFKHPVFFRSLQHLFDPKTWPDSIPHVLMNRILGIQDENHASMALFDRRSSIDGSAFVVQSDVGIIGHIKILRHFLLALRESG